MWWLSIIIAAESDQCALNQDGTLKDASEIDFIHDPDDPHPVISSTIQPLGHGHRTKKTDCLSKSIVCEQLGSDMEDDGGFVAPPKCRWACQTVSSASNTTSLRMHNSFKMLSRDENVTDASDGNFSDDIPALQSCSDSSDSEDDSDTNTNFNMISNEEVSQSINLSVLSCSVHKYTACQYLTHQTCCW